jgi:hypothetical protein
MHDQKNRDKRRQSVPALRVLPRSARAMVHWPEFGFRMLSSLRVLAGSWTIAAGATAVAALGTLAAYADRSRPLSDTIAAICAAALQSSPPEETAYLSENIDAMTKMMVDMSVRPSGNVDKDFVAMMVPHHQGAIAMAATVLRYGHNEQIKRLAQEIIVTQQQEISAMRLAVGEPLPASTPSPTVLRSPSPDVPGVR